MLLSRLPGGEPELFASIQGEGLSVGVPSVFVRLAECNLTCDWCFVPDTPVLLEDFTWRRIGDLRPGARIIGIEQPTRGQARKHVRLAVGEVTRVSFRNAPTVEVNHGLRCTPDHKFWLTGRDQAGRAGAAHSGWREVSRALGLRALFTTPPVEHESNDEYERGWLAGMADGDGCFWTLRKAGAEYRRFRLALNDEHLLERAHIFATHGGYHLRSGGHKTTGFTAKPRTMKALWLTRDQEARAFERWLDEDVTSTGWYAGYVGGILDAEGSHSNGVLRISQYTVNSLTRARIARALAALGLEFTAELQGYYVKRRGGAALRALSLSRPRKDSLLRGPIGSHPHASKVIESVVPTHKLEGVVTLTTTLGSFVAAGYVVKNCDTKYTWDWDNHDKTANTARMTEDAVVERIRELAGANTKNIIFTGGEPMLQQADLAGVARRLSAAGFRIEIETNGTIEPLPELAGLVAQWNVSAKLGSSGNRKTSARLRTGPMTWFAASPRAYFKFVVMKKDDLPEIESIVRTFEVPRDRVILMPEGTSPDEISGKSRWLVPEAQQRGFRFSTRLHVLLWGAERGR